MNIEIKVNPDTAKILFGSHKCAIRGKEAGKF
jgi:hypothetical protein